MTTNKRTNGRRDNYEKQSSESGRVSKQNASNPGSNAEKSSLSEEAAQKKRDAQALSIDPKTVSADRKKMPENRSEGQGKKDEPRFRSR